MSGGAFFANLSDFLVPLAQRAGIAMLLAFVAFLGAVGMGIGELFRLAQKRAKRLRMEEEWQIEASAADASLAQSPAPGAPRPNPPSRERERVAA